MLKRFEDANLDVGVIRPIDMLEGLSQLNSVLREQLKLRSGDETDLRKADFEYWIPNSEPRLELSSWGPLMEEEYTDIRLKVRCQPEDIAARIETISAKSDVITTLSVSWEIGSMRYFQCLDVEHPILTPGTVKVNASHRTMLPCTPEFERRTKRYVDTVVSAWGIPRHLVPATTADQPAAIDFARGSLHFRSVDLFHCPRELNISWGATGVQSAVKYFLSAMNAALDEFGEPLACRMQITVRPNEMDAGQALCKELALLWDIVFFGEYADGFEPCERPQNLEFEHRYPIIRRIRERKKNSRRYQFLDLQVTAVHPPEEESYLLLHTQRDHEFLKTIAANAGLEIGQFGTKGLHELYPLPEDK